METKEERLWIAGGALMAALEGKTLDERENGYTAKDLRRTLGISSTVKCEKKLLVGRSSA